MDLVGWPAPNPRRYWVADSVVTRSLELDCPAVGGRGRSICSSVSLDTFCPYHRSIQINPEGPSLPGDWEEITSSEEKDRSSWKSIPRFAKTLLLMQTVFIAFMSFWIYEEYQNNAYLQAYVNGNLNGISFSLIVIISIIAFTTVALALYLKLRRTRKELEGMLSTESVGTRAGHGLDTRTEEHLIEMIRKTTPAINSGTGGSMPVLRRRDNQYSHQEQDSG
jgi:hypothetical protein